ncbi:hypothetical protein [Sphingomonas sp.]
MRRPIALWWMIGRGVVRIVASGIVILAGSARDRLRGRGSVDAEQPER